MGLTIGLDAVKEIEKHVDNTTAQDWDNPGVQVGSPEREVHLVGYCVTLTNRIVQRGIQDGVDMFLIHHPLSFPKRDPIKRFNGVLYAKLKLLLSKDIFVYSAHTAWDHPPLGTRASLAKRLNIQIPQQDKYLKDSCWGDLPHPVRFSELVREAEKQMNTKAKFIVGEPDKTIRRVAAIAGGGLNDIKHPGIGFIPDYVQEKSIDCVVGADSNSLCRHFIEDAGLCMIDLGHEESETPGLANLVALIEPAVKDVRFREYLP